MNEDFNQVLTLANAASLTDKAKILNLMKFWSSWKTKFLRSLRAMPTTSMQQQENVQEAIDNVEVLHIWPWSGTLEDILKNVGTEGILEHWARCVNFAKDAIQRGTQPAQPAQQTGVAWPPKA